MVTFRNVVLIVGFIVILISFVLAFKLRNKKNLPAYFRFFYWIPLVGILLTINVILNVFNIINIATLSIFQNVLDSVDFFLKSLFFYFLFKRSKVATFMKIVFLGGVLIILVLLLNNIFSQALFHLYAIMNLLIAVFCIFYYYQLLSINENYTLPTKLNTWIVTGLFVGASVNAPLFAILDFMAATISIKIAFGFLIIINIFITITHLLFIKAYKCAEEVAGS